MIFHAQGVDQGTHVDLPCELGVLLACGGEEGYEVEDGIYLMFLHSLAESVEVEGIELDGPGVGADLGHCLVLEVSTDNVVVSIYFLEVGNQFGADLSAGAND